MYAAGGRIGPYVLVQKLGQGGFAPVWLAKEMYGETELRSAAIKLFSLEKISGGSKPSAASEGGGYRAQVIEEARVLCRVEHPNVVRFYSMLNDREHDVIGLAMEYVAGESLDKVLDRDKLARRHLRGRDRGGLRVGRGAPQRLGASRRQAGQRD